MAGLTCAQVLHQAGYRVVVVEKSRGVGGRLATRRLPEARADHGTCYISPKGEQFRALMQGLVQHDVVQVWTDGIHTLAADGSVQAPSDRSPRYVGIEGMSAIAKALTPGLDIRLGQRVIGLQPTGDRGWQLVLESSSASADAALNLTANAVVITTPAPQAWELVFYLAEFGNLDLDGVASLRSVTFDPCIAVMVGYAPECLAAWQQRYPDVRAIAADHPSLGWIGWDSSKRRHAPTPVFVLQSNATFAQAHLEDADLHPAGRSLVDAAATALLPQLATPLWMQVHRWRYALANKPLPQPYLVLSTATPLVCAGDWCGGARVEQAFHSGLAVADYLNQQLQQRAIAPFPMWQTLIVP